MKSAKNPTWQARRAHLRITAIRRAGMPLPGSFFFAFLAGATGTDGALATAVAAAIVDVDAAAVVEHAQGAPEPDAHVVGATLGGRGETGDAGAIGAIGDHVTASIAGTTPTLPVRHGMGSTSA